MQLWFYFTFVLLIIATIYWIIGCVIAVRKNKLLHMWIGLVLVQVFNIIIQILHILMK